VVCGVVCGVRGWEEMEQILIFHNGQTFIPSSPPPPHACRWVRTMLRKNLELPKNQPLDVPLLLHAKARCSFFRP
jgi:hypothetical protein